MYTEISITQLNDFVFCPASIYFHMLYGKTDNIRFQSEYQINGTAAHSAIDEKRYSERAEVICGMDVYCEEYGLIGKIDVYNTKTNVTLDIGYSLLFNMVDSLLQVYGFDVYCGIYHKEFYMRKSLACDLMEPLRPIIDLKVRKAINLKQCKEKDFCIYNHQWTLSYKNSASYVSFLMEEILDYKEEMFRYVQSYYRSFMKEKTADQYISFRL